jgi:hypothetical protein
MNNINSEISNIKETVYENSWVGNTENFVI